MSEPIDLKQRLAELRRDRIFESFVWTAMVLIFLGAVAIVVLTHANYVFASVGIPFLAVWFAGSEITNRRPRTFEAWPTGDLILVFAALPFAERERFVTELCDRVVAKDRMAKAFLYGRAWEGEPDGPRRKVVRERPLLTWPKYKKERINVYDPFRGFRTVTGDSRRTQVAIIYLIAGITIAGAFLKSYSQYLRHVDGNLSRWLSMTAWLAMHVWLFRQLGLLQRSDKKMAMLSGLSTRQLIFVFVHRRWGLREIAGFQLRSRSDEPEARAACLRLGLLMEGADALKRFRTITEARVPEDRH